VFEPLKQFKIK